MPADAEPAVDPQHLLQSLRRFLTGSAATTATTANADQEGELGFEEAGTLVWDATMMPDDAAFLMGELPELPGALAAAAAAAAAHKRWRALEICLGILGNLACHPRANRRILEEEGLPTACLAKLLWVDDAASLAELLRLITGVLGVPDSCQAAERWWALLLKIETLGRLVWIVENTLSSLLLEQALTLLAAVVSIAAGAEWVDGKAGKQQLVPLLLELDLLQLLASTLRAWLARGQAGHQGSAGSSSRGSASPGGWGGSERTAAADDAPAPSTAVAAAVPAVAGHAAAADQAEGAAGSVAEVAAEVSQAAALEALVLLEAMAADPAGQDALSTSGAVQHGLVRIVAEPGDRDMQGLAAVLLAGLDGAGVQLLQHPAAVAAVLARLAAHLPSRTEEAVLLSGLRQAAEEGEACWALLSMLAGALSREATAPPLSHEAAAVGAAPSQLAACTAEVLDLLNDNLRVLCADWSGSSSAARLQSHQAYVLNRLVRVLGGDDQQVMLQAALQRCQRPG